MTTEELTDSLKLRSFSGCISAAFTTIRDNAIPTTRKYWKIMLALAIMQTIVYTFFSTLSNGMLYVGFSFEPAQIAVCGLLAFVLCYCIQGCIFSLINGQGAKWSTLRLFKTIPMQFVFYLIYILFVVGGTYAFMAITKKTPEQTTLFHVVGIALLMALLLIAMLVPATYAFTKYLVEPQSRLYAEFFHDYRLGVKHWGLIFATLFLGVMCTGIVEGTILMPVHVLEAIQNIEAYSMVSQGDEPALPSYFILLYALFCFIKSFVDLYLYAFMTYAIYYVYGTIKLKSVPKKQTEE